MGGRYSTFGRKNPDKIAEKIMKRLHDDLPVLQNIAQISESGALVLDYDMKKSLKKNLHVKWMPAFEVMAFRWIKPNRHLEKLLMKSADEVAEYTLDRQMDLYNLMQVP